ncbi:MAG TPA: YceH family protein [Pyrinomonadaceae bacterium]
MPTLDPIEIRVLGSLIEKQITTPEYYPLTLHSLTAACNQKNNRNPVMSLTEQEVERGLDSLRERNLAYVFHGSTSRVPKFKHVAPEILQLNPAELAVMCVLMLSGAQTVGEIRTRGSRLHEFSGLEEVDETLRGLSARESEPLVVKLPRQAGQKDARYVHLLSGEPDLSHLEAATTEPPTRRAHSERAPQLEEQVQMLKQQVEELARQFAEFRKQFE